ncbi:MAG: hypothetical protein QM597_01520 [Aeromicrobium sp.]|uniref:hypothetical protein n=1 Tax=Aeromicrobium sp. TaxID=1871063 RepID=UPI0039E2D6A5
METLYHALVWAHIGCWAIALFGYVTVLSSPQINGLLAHGVGAAWVLGLVLVAIASMSEDVDDPNHAKVAVKLLVATAAVGLAHGTRKRPAPNPFAHVVVALILVNVGIAYFW